MIRHILQQMGCGFHKSISVLRQTSSFISSPLSICSRPRAQLSTFSRRFITTVVTYSQVSMRSESEYEVKHEHRVRLYNLDPGLFCYSQHPHLIRLNLASCLLLLSTGCTENCFLDLLLQLHWHFPAGL